MISFGLGYLDNSYYRAIITCLGYLIKKRVNALSWELVYTIRQWTDPVRGEMCTDKYLMTSVRFELGTIRKTHARRRRSNQLSHELAQLCPLNIFTLQNVEKFHLHHYLLHTLLHLVQLLSLDESNPRFCILEKFATYCTWILTWILILFRDKIIKQRRALWPV